MKIENDQFMQLLCTVFAHGIEEDNTGGMIALKLTAFSERHLL